MWLRLWVLGLIGGEDLDDDTTAGGFFSKQFHGESYGEFPLFGARTEL